MSDLGRCFRHSSRDAIIRCSKCERAICEKCALPTTIGYRCPDCMEERSATRTISAGRAFLGGSVGFALGCASTLLIPHAFGYLLILAAVLVGSGVGYIVKQLIGYKSSDVVGGLTAAGFIGGAFFEPLRSAALGQNFPQTSFWPLIFAVIGAVVSWMRVRS